MYSIAVQIKQLFTVTFGLLLIKEYDHFSIHLLQCNFAFVLATAMLGSDETSFVLTVLCVTSITRMAYSTSVMTYQNVSHVMRL